MEKDCIQQSRKWLGEKGSNPDWGTLIAQLPVIEMGKVP
jgi:hypothetical protein